MARAFMSPTKDGVLRILIGQNCSKPDGTDDSHKCTPVWTEAATILNIPEQKYTIGSAKDLRAVYKEEEHGQFLLFRDNYDVRDVHCQISCDMENKFWLHSVGYAETFVNGKLVETSKIRLKFGDIFYFSHIFSSLWDPHLSPENSHGLLHKNPSGKLAAVFKFERLIPKGKTKHKNKPQTESILSVPGNKDKNNRKFSKSSPTDSPSWTGHGPILSKIFQHFAESKDYDSLYNCRLVSKCWNSLASPVLKTNLVPKLTVVMDEIVENPNRISRRLHYFNHRMSHLRFTNWKFDIWPIRYGSPLERDNEFRNQAMLKFNQEFATFLQQDFHITNLDLNIDYLVPISSLLVKFCRTLEVITIQINHLWIGDEGRGGVPIWDEKISFPSLKTLRIQFSCGEDEEELEVVKDSKWLKQFLIAASNIETLILSNYALLPVEFKNFKKLKNVRVMGRCEYGIYELHLEDCLNQLNSLPKDQLKYFCINWTEDEDLKGSVDEALPRFLERQKNSLETLELVLPKFVGVSLPKCMPNLGKLWISCDTRYENWGVRLQGGKTSTKSKIGTGFQEMEMRYVPLVCLSDKNNTFDEGNVISLEFGRWNIRDKEFAIFIPNVEKIWAWSR